VAIPVSFLCSIGRTPNRARGTTLRGPVYVTPGMPGKATAAGRTSVPSAIFGTWLSGGFVPETTQSSRS